MNFTELEKQNAEKWKITSKKLREARSLATSLRCLLEEIQSDEDEPTDELLDSMDSAGEIESWLDSLKINEDGTSANEDD